MTKLNNATTWLLSIFDSNLPAPAKLIAAYLRTHMNDYQEIAFPAVGRIAAMTSQSERTVQRHLIQLCDTGWLSNQGVHPKYGTHQYLIITPVTESPPRSSVQIPPSQSHPSKPISKPITTTTRFKPPTLDELTDYCAEKSYTFDPEQFIAHYTTNGWKVGRNPMKNWKSACVTWQKKEKDNANTKRPNQPNKNTRRLSRGDEVRAAREAARQRAST